jgi:hypothetical protein
MPASRRSIVRAFTTTGVTSLTTSAFPTSPVVGDTIVLIMSTWTGSAHTHNTPTDNYGNTYVEIGTQFYTGASSLDPKLSYWRAYVTATGAGFTVTGNINTAATTTVIARCLKDVAFISYNSDTAEAAPGSGTTHSVGPTSPAPSIESFFIAALATNTPGTKTVGSGWQFEDANAIQSDNTNGQDLYTEILTGITSASAQTATFGLPATAKGALRIASFASATYERVGTVSGSSTGTSASVTLASGATNGDLAIVFVLRDNAGSITINQSYAEQNESPGQDSFSVAKAAVFAKVLTGSDTTPTLNFGSSGKIRWISVVYRGFNTIQDCQVATDSTFANTAPFAAADAGGHQCLSILLQGSEGSWALVTPPSGYLPILNTTGGDYGCVLYEDQTVGTGTVSPGNATLDSGKNDVTFHLLLRQHVVSDFVYPISTLLIGDWEPF